MMVNICTLNLLIAQQLKISLYNAFMYLFYYLTLYNNIKFSQLS